MKEKGSVKTHSIAIIGAGFSGMVAAVYLHRLMPSAKVTLYEGLSRVGKKILVTGNGRCNLTNRDVSFSYYHGDEKLFSAVYPCADNNAMTGFFEGLGLICREDFAGRVYPVSNQASSVLDALYNEVQRSGAEIVTDCKITSLEKKNGRWLLNGNYSADSVLFACGGRAAPVHGSDGSGLSLLSSLGVSVTTLTPSLVPLYIKGFTKSLKGIRAQGTVSIKQAGKTIAADTGEIQYTDYGLSGIPVFQVSSVAAKMLSSGTPVTVFVDSAPFMTADELKTYLIKQIKKYPSAPCESITGGIMPKKLGAYYLRECSLNPEKAASSISVGAAEKLAQAIKSKKYSVTSTGSFNDAQVTGGGIDSNEINHETLAVKKLKGVFACGEMLDIDGLCGGYNLQWAYSSAVYAAQGIVKELSLASDK